MDKIAIIYGSSTGNTETVALKMAEMIGRDMAEPINVKDLTPSRLEKYRNLIFGTSTRGIGELQEDWKNFLPELAKADLSNRVIALYGLGDYESYPESFVDGMGILYKIIRDKGCTIIGQTGTAGYQFDFSTAVHGHAFIGLPLDQDNDASLTEDRIKGWLKEILNQFV